MLIENQIDVLKKGRNLMYKLVQDLSMEQINHIPKGHKNHIGWNIAHLVVTQQLLCYQFSGLELNIPEKWVNLYKKGTNALSNVITQEEWGLILQKFLELPDQLENDYRANKFENYTEYKTSVNVVLDGIDKAVDFNNFHEGIHLGVLLAQKKLV